MEIMTIFPIPDSKWPFHIKETHLMTTTEWILMDIMTNFGWNLR